MKTEVTDEQKREVKAFIDNLTAQYTDTLSVIYEALGLDTALEPKPPRQAPNNLDDVLGRPPTYRGE